MSEPTESTKGDAHAPSPPPSTDAEPTAVKRSRRMLVTAVLMAVALTAASFFGLVRVGPGMFGVVRLSDLTELQRARVIREAGLHECGSKHWRACLEELDHAKGLDPKGDESPAVQEGRMQAILALHPLSTPEIATLRAKAFADCDAQRWAECLDDLDRARQQDPQGDMTEDITVARSKAAHGLRDAGPGEQK